GKALDERVWGLATRATKLAGKSKRATPRTARLIEATAALQDLALSLAPADGPTGAPARLEQLRGLQARGETAIRCAHNGPYLVMNAERVRSWLGEELPARPLMALCRCGESALQPLCHGACARIGVSREPAIEVSRDGPYRVKGAIALTEEDGGPVARAAGSSPEHYALCRCGHSQNKPFCSGMHWYIDFKDPLPDTDREPTLFEWCGGLPALTRMTRLFYEK